jgi:molybdate transport system regulatory protein
MARKKRHPRENAMAAGPTRRDLQVKGRLWVEKGGQTYLSWGRVVLLERIAQLGSVSGAAKSMGMSFSHAWQLVESMNALADQPLVAKQTGGKGGGGAWLTEEGRAAVERFWELVEGFQGWIQDQRL